MSNNMIAPSSKTRVCRRTAVAVLALLCLFNLIPSTARAATRVWSGAVNGYWNVPGNWSSGGVPTLGDADQILHFPAGTRYQSTNNVGPITVTTLRFNGNVHHIYGNSVQFVAAAAQTNIVMASAGMGAYIHLPLIFPAGSRTVYAEFKSTLVIEGPISGQGTLQKIGPGLLRLGGDGINTFTGGLRQLEGKVALGKTFGASLAGPVIVGESNSTSVIQLVYEGNHQIADASDVSIRGQQSQLMLEGFTDTINNLELIGGEVITYESGFGNNEGNLVLNGNITARDSTSPVPTEASITGRLNLGNAQRTITVPPLERLIIFGHVGSTGTNGGMTLTGGGVLQLSLSNGFAGPLRIEMGKVYAYNSYALGTADGATILDGGGELILGYGTFVPAEPLVVRENSYLSVLATNSWHGPVVVQSNAVLRIRGSGQFGGYDWLTLGGAISGPGQVDTQIDRVDFLGAAPNTVGGGHVIWGPTFAVLAKSSSNALTGPIRLRPGGISGSVRYPEILWGFHHQVGDGSSISWDDSFSTDYGVGRLNLNNKLEVIGSLAGKQMMNIDCGIGRLTIGANGLNSDCSGRISGSSGGTNLVKIGTGTLVLGTETLGLAHDLAGKTVVESGALILRNAVGVGAVHVANNARFAGSGLFASVTASPNGAITPGLLLTPQNYGSLRPGTFAPGGGLLGLELAGPAPGSSYDQLLVATTVDLNGVLLQVSALNLPHGSNSFTLISLSGTTPATGTFIGLPEGTVFPSNDGKLFRITYHGGDGNDVVVTRHYTGPIGGQIGGVTPLPDGRMQIDGTGLAGQSYRVQASTNFLPGSWIDLGSTEADAESGVIQFIDPGATSFPHRFYRFFIQ